MAVGVGEKEIMTALDDVVSSVHNTDSTIESTWREFKPRIIRNFFRDGAAAAALAVEGCDGGSGGDGGDVVELVGKSPESNSPFVWDVEVTIRSTFFLMFVGIFIVTMHTCDISIVRMQHL